MKEPPVPQKKPAKKPTKKAAKKNPAKKAAKKKKASKKKAAKKKAAKKKDDEELLETDVSNTDFVFKKSIDPSFGEVLNGKASKDPAFDEELVQDVSGELNVGRDQTNWKDMDDIEFKDILDGNKKDSQDIAFARQSTAHKAVTLLQQPTELLQDPAFVSVLNPKEHLKDPDFADDLDGGESTVKDIAFSEILVQTGASAEKLHSDGRHQHLLGAPFNGHADLAFDSALNGNAGPAGGLLGKNDKDPAFEEIMEVQEDVYEDKGKGKTQVRGKKKKHAKKKHQNPDEVFGTNDDPAFAL